MVVLISGDIDRNKFIKVVQLLSKKVITNSCLYASRFFEHGQEIGANEVSIKIYIKNLIYKREATVKYFSNQFFLFFLITIFMLTGCAPVLTPIQPTNTSIPTSTPFIMPLGNFQISWNTYSSQYNSLGGIVTIRRQGTKYTKTLVMSDKSCNSIDLEVISESDHIKLTDQPGNDFGDYMVIIPTGELAFYDNQGIIYSVPLLVNVDSSSTICVQPVSEQGKEFVVAMSLVSVDSIGGGKVNITLTTNLPDGMKLMVDLKNSGDYWAQDDPAVSNGQLVMTFGNVPSGNFLLSISSVSTSLQPENVKNIIGKNGANMTGDLITFDQSFNSYFLEYTTNIMVN